MYGNETYPDSNRMYSRPFAVYFLHLLPNQASKDSAEFRYGLLRVGQDLIGSPFNYCCDIEAFPAPYFSAPLWYKDSIEKFGKTAGYQKYKSSLSQESQLSLDLFISRIDRLSFSDGPAYVPGFKQLWRDDIFLDPRLTLAEEIFFYAADGGRPVVYSSLNVDSNERYLASLKWMAEPENAKRVSLMFLYSRLAQHFSEVDPKSLIIAKNVAAEIEQGKNVVTSLRERPHRYLAEASRSSAPVKFFMDAFLSFGELFSRPSPIKNAEGLAASAEDIVKDYRRLRDGSWAMAQAALLQSDEIGNFRPVTQAPAGMSPPSPPAPAS